MKVKTVKTTILEGGEFKLPPKRLLTPKDKVDIMEHLLAQNGETLQQIGNDGDVGIFYHNCIKMLLNGDMVDYFQLLKMCKDMAEREKEQRKDVDFL